MVKRTRVGDSLIAVAYIRVSKDEQRLGLEAQRAQSKRGLYARAYGSPRGTRTKARAA